MPLLPGMEGDLNKDSPSTPLSLIIHWQYQTISRGPDSLIGRLKKLTPKPENYIEFYSFFAAKTPSWVVNLLRFHVVVFNAFAALDS